MPGSDHPGASAAQKEEWAPPKEIRTRQSCIYMILRMVVLGVVLYAGYTLITTTTREAFTPVLTVHGAVTPDQRIPAGETFTLGLVVSNPRMEAGAAYVVAVIDGDTEIEGAVVEVPQWRRTVVPVEISAPPGTRIVTLVLYDAWHENVRVDARHGIKIELGESDIALVSAEIPDTTAVPGGVNVEMSVSNRGTAPQSAIPLFVLLPTVEGDTAEIEGDLIRVGAGDADSFVRTFTLPENPAGKYHVSLILLDPNGGKLGTGIYHLPIGLEKRD